MDRPLRSSAAASSSSGKSPIATATSHKSKFLTKIGRWASAFVPPLGALIGSRLAATHDNAGVPPPSILQCQRCESVLDPGVSCTLIGNDNKPKSRPFYVCNYCNHRNPKVDKKSNSNTNKKKKKKVTSTSVAPSSEPGSNSTKKKRKNWSTLKDKSEGKRPKTMSVSPSNVRSPLKTSSGNSSMDADGGGSAQADFRFSSLRKVVDMEAGKVDARLPVIDAVPLQIVVGEPVGEPKTGDGNGEIARAVVVKETETVVTETSIFATEVVHIAEDSETLKEATVVELTSSDESERRDTEDQPVTEQPETELRESKRTEPEESEPLVSETFAAKETEQSGPEILAVKETDHIDETVMPALKETDHESEMPAPPESEMPAPKETEQGEVLESEMQETEQNEPAESEMPASKEHDQNEKTESEVPASYGSGLEMQTDVPASNEFEANKTEMPVSLKSEVSVSMDVDPNVAGSEEVEPEAMVDKENEETPMDVTEHETAASQESELPAVLKECKADAVSVSAEPEKEAEKEMAVVAEPVKEFVAAEPAAEHEKAFAAEHEKETAAETEKGNAMAIPELQVAQVVEDVPVSPISPEAPVSSGSKEKLPLCVLNTAKASDVDHNEMESPTSPAAFRRARYLGAVKKQFKVLGARWRREKRKSRHMTKLALSEKSRADELSQQLSVLPALKKQIKQFSTGLSDLSSKVQELVQEVKKNAAAAQAPVAPRPVPVAQEIPAATPVPGAHTPVPAVTVEDAETSDAEPELPEEPEKPEEQSEAEAEEPEGPAIQEPEAKGNRPLRVSSGSMRIKKKKPFVFFSSPCKGKITLHKFGRRWKISSA